MQLDDLDNLTATVPAKSKGGAGSFGSQVSSLAVGETCVKAQRLPMCGEEAQDLQAFFRKFRSSIDPAVSKERKNNLKEFIVEQGSMITAAGFVLAVVSVTRT